MTAVIEDISEKAVTFTYIRQESQDSTQIMVVNGDLRRFSEATKAGAVASLRMVYTKDTFTLSRLLR